MIGNWLRALKDWFRPAPSSASMIGTASRAMQIAAGYSLVKSARGKSGHYALSLSIVSSGGQSFIVGKAGGRKTA
jgi:hypothetical protein